MSKYFDKGFFKFLMGFVAIIALSMFIIMVTRIYEEKQAESSQKIDNSLEINTTGH